MAIESSEVSVTPRRGHGVIAAPALRLAGTTRDGVPLPTTQAPGLVGSSAHTPRRVWKTARSCSLSR